MSANGPSAWPTTIPDLEAAQRAIASKRPSRIRDAPGARDLLGGCFVCFPRGQVGFGQAGDPAWAAAALTRSNEIVARDEIEGRARAPYAPGHLALREGPLLEAAVAALPERPALLLVNATGADHPRRCGLALHLGYVLDLPTVGVTHRPLYADGEMPAAEPGEAAPLWLEGEVVARWVRVRRGARPLAAHPAWRTDVDTAAKTVFAAARDGARTPLPVRAARQAARAARALAQGYAVGPAGPL